MKSKQYQLPLFIGLGLLGLIGLVLLFPELLAKHNPYALSTIQFWLDDSGQLKIATAPYGPGSQYLLGSDQLGRDLLSFIAYGMRMTLFAAVAVSALRLLIALLAGMASALGSEGAKQFIHKTDRLFVTLPPLLAAVLILRTDWFTSLQRSASIGLFVLMLTVVGWSKLGTVFEKTAARIACEAFIDSERALGKSKWQIAKKHLLPHMLPEITVLFFMEIAQVLTLMMQLGLFSVFIGNLKVVQDSGRDGYNFFNITFEPEWSSLLGTARDYIRVAPWIALWTGVAFFLTVFAFNLVGEGLRMRYQQRDSKVRSPFAVIKNRSVQGGIVVIVLLSTIAFWPETHPFLKSSLSLPAGEAEPVTVGSKPSKDLQRLMEEHMKTLGIEPMSSEFGYKQNFELPSQLEIGSTQMTWKGQPQTYLETFKILSGKPGNYTGSYVLATADYFSSRQKDYEKKWLLIDSELISTASVMNQMPLLKEQGVSGVLVSGNMPSELRLETEIPVVWISDAFEKMLEVDLEAHPADEKSSLVLNLKGQVSKNGGTNLFGKIGGKEPMLSKSTLIIGMDLTSKEGQNANEKAAFYAGLIESLNHYGANMDRTLVFAFFDGEEGLRYYSEHSLIQNQHVNLFLDLTDISSDQFDKLTFSRELSPISRYYGYGFADKFQKRGAQIIDTIDPLLSDEDRLLFDLEGLTTLRVSTESHGDKSLTDVGQLILDTLMEVSL